MTSRQASGIAVAQAAARGMRSLLKIADNDERQRDAVIATEYLYLHFHAISTPVAEAFSQWITMKDEEIAELERKALEQEGK